MKIKKLSKVNIQKRHIWLLSSGLFLILSAIVILWLNQIVPANSSALVSFESSTTINVVAGDFYSFNPIEASENIGVIIFPKSKVDPVAYGPLARIISEQGYTVIIIRPLFGLYSISPDFAENAISKFPREMNWVTISHGDSSTYALRLAKENPKVVAAVTLAAIAKAKIPAYIDILPLWGTDDGIISKEKILNSVSNYLSNPELVEIEGGNHSWFADIDKLANDNQGAIDFSTQVNKSSLAIIDFLRKVDSKLAD